MTNPWRLRAWLHQVWAWSPFDVNDTWTLDFSNDTIHYSYVWPNTTLRHPYFNYSEVRARLYRRCTGVCLATEYCAIVSPHFYMPSAPPTVFRRTC